MHVSPRADISWAVGELERIDFRIFCGMRVLFRADQRNSTRFGIILCLDCSGLLRVRTGQVIEIFRFRKLWLWRGKIEIVNQFIGKL